MDTALPLIGALPLLEIQPDAQLIVDPAGIVLASNLAAARLLGADPLAVDGSYLSTWIASDASGIETLLRQALRSTQPVPSRFKLRRADGSTVDAHAHTAALRGALLGGGAAAWVRLSSHSEGVSRFVELNQRIDELAREVAERKRVEASLLQQRRWLSVILRSIADGVIATDAAGLVVFLNPTAERITGWTEADAAGQPVERVFTVLHPSSRQSLPNPVRQAIETRAHCTIEAGSILVTPHGKEWPIDDAAAPICDPDGAVLGAVLVFREISVRVRADRERSELEERLRETQKLEAIGTLAGGIAHDLTLPLNPVALSTLVTRPC